LIYGWNPQTRKGTVRKMLERADWGVFQTETTAKVGVMKAFQESPEYLASVEPLDAPLVSMPFEHPGGF